MADLQKIGNMAARILQSLYKRQAPKKTGELKTSIKVSAKVTSNGLSFVTSYAKYGIFTDKGTGPYRSRRMGEWNPKPGKGKGGIRPRYWTAIDSMTRSQIAKLVTKWVKEQVVEDFRNQLT